MSNASTFRPRHTRLDQYGQAIEAAARALGLKAIDCAKLRIRAVFDSEAFDINSLKRRVEINLRRGANDHEVRNRYAVVADHLGLPDCLASALLVIRRALVNERLIQRRQVKLWGRPESPATMDRLREAHLIMRWLRANDYAHAWPAILESLNEDPRLRRPTLFVIEGGKQHQFAAAAE